MTRRQKNRWIPAAVVLAGLLAVGSCCIYWSFHPQITITRTVRDSDVRFDGEYHYERIMTVMTSTFGLPVAKPVIGQLNTLFDWCNEIDTDLYENYTAPLHITVSGEVRNGATTFCYEGYATAQDGKTVSYREEQTFDYVFVPHDKLFQ